MKNKSIILLVIGVLLFSLASINVSAVDNVCCEKTTTGFFCQNAPQSQCATGFKTAPTSCKSTSFCKPGVCYNTLQGTCLENTPENVCTTNGGTWSLTKPAACNLGCCILGDQASFVTLTRCKYLAGSLGLQTNFNKGITDEAQCIQQVQNQDKGACVYDFEFQRTCKFTTRAECGTGVNGSSKGEFFKDKLCTADELNTNCGWTKKTACAPGKDGVYFLDSCGNFANIYDSSKVPNVVNLSQAPEEIRTYWTNVKTKEESCNPSGANENSKSCGNCDYLSGSYCRSSDVAGVNANYGDFVCADLKCKTSEGEKKHGESWCVYDDKGTTGKSNNAVGSRFYKHICINGEEVVEQCADFRQEECIQDTYKTASGKPFTAAACRVNRWQDCLTQVEKDDCLNTDKRDCNWIDGVKVGNSTGDGSCVPKNTPGLKFWEGDEAKNACAQGNYQCLVTFEKGLLGGESCVSGCECLDENWKQQRIALCQSIGDCGPKINFIGESGYKSGYNITTTKK